MITSIITVLVKLFSVGVKFNFYKIREHISVKIPILFVIGQKEIEDKTVTIRELGNDEQKTINLEEAISEIRSKANPPDSHN